MVVTAVVSLNVAFTAAVLYVFLRTGAEPTALVGAWFAFTTAELWQLATIRKQKSKSKEVSKSDEAS